MNGPRRRPGDPRLPQCGQGDAAAADMVGDVEVRRLDLQDLASVRLRRGHLVDVPVNNAGIMAVPYALTKDGFESQIGTNHLGHFALTNLLLPKITDRVVTVSSMMHWTGVISLRDQLEGPAVLGVAGVRPVRSWPICSSPASFSGG